MAPEQIELVKSTWSQVSPIADKAAELFYGKLFELDPELKSLFKSDMTEQGRKLMQMISTAVNSLDKLEAVVPAVENLGERHAGYGVKDKDYDTVGIALLWTLETGLGNAFTPEAKQAWTITYGVLAQTMINAAAKAA
ncbi:MAG: globin family protein [Gammaproteobacteria bacterium]|jgi:hemoglobin-like flavoprotein